MVGKTYLRYVRGPESGVVCSTGALSMDAAVLKPNGAPIVAVPALEYVNLWNTRTSALVAKLLPPLAAAGKRTSEVTAVQLVRDPLVSGSWLLVAGYASGHVAMWRGKGEDAWSCVLYGLSHRPDSIVLSVDVASDGLSLATGGGDTDITLWDTSSEEPQFRLVGHRGGVVGVAFVAGAKMRTLISGAADGLVKVWNLEVQQCVQTIIASDTQVTSVRADIAGARLFVGVRDDVLKVYSLEALRSTESDIDGAAALRDGVSVITEHGTLKRKIAKPATSIVFNGQRQDFMAVVTNKTVEVFRVLSAAEVKKKLQRKKRRRMEKAKEAAAEAGAAATTGKAKKSSRAEGPDADDTAAAKQPDGAGDDAEDGTDAAFTIQRSVTEEIVPLRIYHLPTKIRGAAFVATKGTANVLRLAVATNYNTVDLYDISVVERDEDDDVEGPPLTLGDLKHRLAIDSITHENDIRHLAFTSNSMAVASMSSDALKAWGTRNKAALMDDEATAATDAAFEEERRAGRDAALPSASRMLGCTGTLNALADGVDLAGGFVLLPGDTAAVVGTADGKLLVVDLLQAAVMDRVEAHPPTPVTGLALSHDGANIVSVGKDRRLLKWDITLEDAPSSSSSAKSKVVRLMLAEEVELSDTPLYVRATPDGKLIGIAMQDHNVQLLYADSMKPFLTLYGHKLPVTAIAFSADSTLCATVGMDKSLRFWGLDFGDCHRSIHAHDDYITDVKFVGDTHYVFTGSLDGSVKQWDADTWTLIQTHRVHQRGVWAIAVTLDGTFVATAGVDKCIRTLMRSDAIIFPEEEQEREAQEALDEAAARDSDRQRLEDLNAGGDVAAGGHRSVATAEAGEHLMECLDAVSIELQRLADGGAGEPAKALRGHSVWEYMWSAIMRIRPSELRHALSSLTSVHVASLLRFMDSCIAAGAVSSYEIAGRVLLALVKPAPGSNTPASLIIGDDVNVLQLLDGLQHAVAAGLHNERARLGRISAGLAFVQRSMAKHERVVFYDTSKVQGAQRKFHKAGLGGFAGPGANGAAANGSGNQNGRGRGGGGRGRGRGRGGR